MTSLRSIVTSTLQVNGQTLTLQTGRLAPQADAAVLCRLGETVVLATVVASRTPTDLDYFPLFVEYQEKLYAGGIIKGSRWVKREGRPSDEAILTARLIDRSIRPLFPKDFRHEVQVIVTVLSVDGQNDPDIPALVAASAALAISPIPWEGPIGSLRLGLADRQLIVNPTYKQRESSPLDLVVSATQDSIVMVEAGASEVSEDQLIQALQHAQTQAPKIIAAINQLVEKAGQPKLKPSPSSSPDDLLKDLQKKAQPLLKDYLASLKDPQASPRFSDLVDTLSADFPDISTSQIHEQLLALLKKQVTQQLFSTGRRPDGRRPDEIRPLHIEVGLLPRTHGSALFQRGKTQALTTVTLGSPSLEQWIESMEGQEFKRYIHHYYMPPYSVGETGRLGWPSRREIGHGALAERALLPLIPDEDVFPYTIRVVSEIMSSNGSTSMASVCGSSLALMDAGVPLKKPVAGIAMGLLVDPASPSRYQVLTDIQGLEDHIGDMDFKVAGTQDGVTALQMDIKLKGISLQVLKDALQQARQARLFILEKMKAVIPAPRARVSPHAPKIAVLKIEEDKIGDLIGPGGRIIRKIIKETGATIDVDEEGKVTISAPTQDAVNQALTWVDNITREIQPGEEFDGVVKRVEPFGIFVEIAPGREGLVHISRMAPGYVADPSQLAKVGDTVHVRVTAIDELGRLSLTMLTPEEEQRAAQRRATSPRPPRRFSSRRPRRHHRR